MEKMQFEKKQVIFSEGIGVCVVDEIAKLAATKDSEPVLYYGLRSVTQKNKVSYVPVENHQVQLRELISEEEAMELKKKENLSAFQKEEVEYVLKEGIFSK